MCFVEDAEVKPGLVNRLNTGMTRKDYDAATKSLLKDGIIEEVKDNGRIYYKLTSLGEKLRNHFDSDEKSQN